MEEILDETNQLDVSGKTKQWLQMEALNHNPKIEVGIVGIVGIVGSKFQRSSRSLFEDSSYNFARLEGLFEVGGIFMLHRSYKVHTECR